MEKIEIEVDDEAILKVGKIAAEVREYAKSIIKKDMPLLEIAEKIEAKIEELGAKPAFPTNLSINEIAAHYTPSHEDKTLATGLLKIDFGVQVNGYTADTAFSIDLENSDENLKLIKSSEDALENAIKYVTNNQESTEDSIGDSGASSVSGGGALKKVNKKGGYVNASEIGKIIQKTIESQNLSPIINLSGHSMEQYELHAGITIPNVDDKKNTILDSGLYAIEPFSTNGSGKVRDGKPSGIYQLQNIKYALNAYFIQINDIDASITSTWNDGYGFEPLGTYDILNRFRGNYNGDGYKIMDIFTTICGVLILRKW